MKNKRALNNQIINSLYFLVGGSKLKFTVLAFLTVGSSLLELLGMGLLIPIVFIKFLPGEQAVSGRIEKVTSLLGFEKSGDIITYLMLGFVCILIFRSIFQVAYVYLQGKVLGNWRIHVESMLLRNHLVADVDANDISDRTRLQVKINQVTKFIDKSATAMFDVIASALIVASFLIVLMIIDMSIALAGIGTVLFLSVIRVLTLKYSNIFDDELDYSLSALQKKAIDDSVNLMKEIKIYRKEFFFYNRFSYYNRRLINLMKKGRTVSILPDSITQISFVLFIAVALFFSPDIGEYFSGQKIAFIIFVAIRMLPRVSRLQKNLLNIYSGHKGAAIIQEAISFHDKTKKFTEKQSVPVTNSLKFCDVSYSFGKKNFESDKNLILDRVNFEIKQGAFIGLVGPSGAGKTTLMEMIAGLRHPIAGSIIVDGVEIKPDNRQWNKIGYLSQNASTVAGGLQENVAFGYKKRDVDKHRVRKVLSVVGLTYLREREKSIDGVEDIVEQLSAGEKQRLGMARALYEAEDVLLLDEPTSNLDHVNEDKILEVIGKQRGKLTIVMVAHRLETLKNCDMLLHVEKGKVSEVFKDEIGL